MNGRFLRCVAALAFAVILTRYQEAVAQGLPRYQLLSDVNPLDIVGYDAVQKGLGLNPEEAKKVNRLIDDYRDARQKARDSIGFDLEALRKASSDEQNMMRGKLRVAMMQVADTFNKKLTEILDKHQLERLHEIGLQIGGAGTLQNSAVIKELGLTNEQQRSIAGINEEYDRKVTQLVRGEGPGPLARPQMQKRMEKVNKMKEEFTAKAIAVLTKAQQDQFAQMKGKPFDTSSLTSRPRRPRPAN